MYHNNAEHWQVTPLHMYTDIMTKTARFDSDIYNLTVHSTWFRVRQCSVNSTCWDGSVSLVCIWDLLIRRHSVPSSHIPRYWHTTTACPHSTLSCHVTESREQLRLNSSNSIIIIDKQQLRNMYMCQSRLQCISTNKASKHQASIFCHIDYNYTLHYNRMLTIFWGGFLARSPEPPWPISWRKAGLRWAPEVFRWSIPGMLGMLKGSPYPGCTERQSIDRPHFKWTKHSLGFQEGREGLWGEGIRPYQAGHGGHGGQAYQVDQGSSDQHQGTHGAFRGGEEEATLRTTNSYIQVCLASSTGLEGRKGGLLLTVHDDVILKLLFYWTVYTLSWP